MLVAERRKKAERKAAELRFFLRYRYESGKAERKVLRAIRSAKARVKPYGRVRVVEFNRCNRCNLRLVIPAQRHRVYQSNLCHLWAVKRTKRALGEVWGFVAMQ